MNETVVSAAEFERRQKLQNAPWRSVADLMKLEFPPVQWCVPGFLPEGLTLLAARPKIGKSWLMLDIALAVSEGRYVLDGERLCSVGDVLYLALEDNPRRLQSRIRKLMQSQMVNGDRLSYHTEWPRVDEGCAEQVREWASTVERPRLVIIDTLQRIRPMREKDGYKADYEALKSLQQLAAELGIAIVVVHHTRKQEGGEAVDAISGTLGLAGCADAHMVIRRDGQGVTLYSEGRDIPGGEHAMEFNKETCRWRLLGNASEVRRSNERKVIMDVLRDNLGNREAGDNLGDNFSTMTPTEIAEETGMKQNNVKQLLRKMAENGEILNPERGKYCLPKSCGDG